MNLVKIITASTAISTIPIVILGIHGKAGTDACTIAIANSSGAGTEVIGGGVSSSAVYGSFDQFGGVPFSAMAYATVTGTSPKFWIYYKKPPG